MNDNKATKKKPIGFVIKFIAANKPSLLILQLLVVIFGGIGSAINVLLMKYAVDSISIGRSIQSVVWVILAFIGFYTAGLLYATWFKCAYVPRAVLHLREKMNLNIFRKIIDTDIEQFEETDFYNKYSRAVLEAENRIINVCDSLFNLIGSLVGIAGIVAVIMLMDGWMLVISIVSLLFSIFFSSKLAPVRFSMDQERLPHYRRLDYVKRILSSQQYCKELKLYPVGNLLIDEYHKEKNIIDDNLKKTGKKLSPLSFFSEFVGLITDPAIILYLAVSIMSGRLVIGDFAALIMASSNFRNMIGGVLNHIPVLKEHSMYISQLQEFLDMSSKVETNVGTSINETMNNMEASGVGFTYLSGTHAVSDVSFSIKKGEKIAIVGENGAGKTSLIKLLLRLYDTSEGKIRINGIDYKDITTAALRAHFATVFQDFQYYAMSIAENVLMKRVETKEEEEKVWRALDLCGLGEKIRGLEKGIYSQLTQEFDNTGVLLSGGELQKLAIARAIAGDSDILIMDEPSSAMDPISEKKFFEMVFENFKDKTIIMVSHHLSYTTKFDKICYMKNGKITEAGTFRQLLDLNGGYAELYNAQLDKFSA